MNLFAAHLLRTHLRIFALTLLTILIVAYLFQAGPPPSVESEQIAAEEPVKAGPLPILAARLSFALPLTCLFATVLTLGPLSYGRELAALAAVGRSPFQILWPLLVVGVACSLSLVVFNLLVFPPISSNLSNAVRETELGSRWAHITTPLSATVIGAVLGSSPRKTSRFSGIAWGLLLLLAYGFLSSFGGQLGEHGVVPGVMAGSATAALSAVVSVVWWWRDSWRVRTGFG